MLQGDKTTMNLIFNHTSEKHTGHSLRVLFQAQICNVRRI